MQPREHGARNQRQIVRVVRIIEGTEEGDSGHGIACFVRVGTEAEERTEVI